MYFFEYGSALAHVFKAWYQPEVWKTTIGRSLPMSHRATLSPLIAAAADVLRTIWFCLLLLATARTATAQLTVQAQNQGTVLSTFKTWLVINCSTNITCTYSSGKLNLTTAGGLPTGLTFTAPTLTVSTAGSGNRQLALSGNTSGTCNFTTDATKSQDDGRRGSSDSFCEPQTEALTTGTAGF